MLPRVAAVWGDVDKWLPRVGQRVDGLQRGTRKLLGMMEMFCILIAVVVSQVREKFKTH